MLSDTPNYPKLKGFRIGHLNITSLLKYIEELKTYLADNQFEILSINETRLDTEIEDGAVEIPGYDIIRQDRNRSGGGVAIYVRDNIPYIKRDDLFGQGLEAICLEIKKAKCKPFLVTTWYRPPNSPVEIFDKFENFLHLAENKNIDLIITGDLNCNLLATKSNSHTKKLTDLLDIYQLRQHIKTPTRTTLDTKTLIDLIITKIEDTKVIDSGVIELGISDHDLVYICHKISLPKQRPKTVETRQFKHFNPSAFQHDLCEVFKTCAFHSDRNIAWEEWKEAFLNVANFHAPIRTRRVKSAYTPWLTD